METKQELRQGKNAITLVGEIKEHKLKLNSNEKGEYINGSLIIKTGEFSEISLEVYVGEKTKKGTTRKVFTSLKKIIDEEYKTLANVEEDEEVTKVRIFGNGGFTPQFKEDIFKVQDTGEVITKIKMNLGFGNVYVDNSIKQEDYKAEFDIEAYIQNMAEEVKNEECTGRTIVQVLLPVYGGKVIPLKLIAGIVRDENEEIDLGEDFLNTVDIGSTMNLWGKINYQSIIKTVKKEGGIGLAKLEEKREYVNELIIEGGGLVLEGKEFDPDLIKQALIERENEIEEVKNKEIKSNKGIGLKDKTSKTKRERPRF